MICYILRHYPAYNIETVYKLTPKQAYIMMNSLIDEKLETAKTIASIFGYKDDKSNNKDKNEDFKYNKENLDSITNSHLKELINRKNNAR